MVIVKLISFLLVLTSARGQFFKIFNDGSYDFNYHTSGGQHRSEVRYADGTVKGKYAFMAPDGQRIQVEYTAGKHGYKERRKLTKSRPILKIQHRPVGGRNFGSQTVVFQPPTSSVSNDQGLSFNPPSNLLVTTWKPFVEDFGQIHPPTSFIDDNKNGDNFGTQRQLIFRQPVRNSILIERGAVGSQSTTESPKSLSTVSSDLEIEIDKSVQFSSTPSSNQVTLGVENSVEVSTENGEKNNSVIVINLGMSGVDNKSFEVITPDMLKKDKLQLEELEPEVNFNIQKDMKNAENTSRQNNQNKPIPSNGFSLPPENEDDLKILDHQVLSRNKFPNQEFFQPNQEFFQPNQEFFQPNQEPLQPQPLQPVTPLRPQSPFPPPFRPQFNRPFTPENLPPGFVPANPPHPSIQTSLSPSSTSGSPPSWFNAKPLPFPPANLVDQHEAPEVAINKRPYTTAFRVPISYHFPDHRVPYPVVANNQEIEPRLD